jgi:hypothetical protein
MKSFGKNLKESSSTKMDFNEERAFTENILNQRVSFYLIFFAIVIAAAVLVKSKVSFLVILFLGMIISWVLSVTIIVTAKRLGSMDRKFYGVIIRILIGYFLPLFCSLLITVAFTIGSVGFFDTYLSLDLGKVTTIEQDIKKIEDKITKPDSAALKNNPNFKDIDIVIKEGSRNELADQNANKAAGKNVKKNTPALKDNPNFRSIESIIGPKKK